MLKPTFEGKRHDADMCRSDLSYGSGSQSEGICRRVLTFAPSPYKDNTMATRFIDFLFRCFFASPDQDYRGVPSVKDDQLFDKTMTGIAVVAAIAVVVLEVLK